MAVANKIFSNGRRVLQKRNSMQKVIFNDADIVFSMSVNTTSRPSGNSVTINWGVSQDVYITWNIGTNANLIQKISNVSVNKNLNTNEDGNGGGNGSNNEVWNNNLLVFTNIDAVKTLNFTGAKADNTVYLIDFKNLFNALLEINANNLQLDFKFLQNAPNLKKLKAGIQILAPYNTIYLKNSNLKYLYLNGYNNLGSSNFFSSLPQTLQFFRFNYLVSDATHTIDLKDFFNGERLGLGCDTCNTIKYSGGAIFPANMVEDVDAKPDYVLFHSSSVTNKMSADQTARFLLDLANQVKSVTMTNRSIRLVGGSVNTSYVDNSQPLYKTYTEAFNYITNILKITVTFT